MFFGLITVLFQQPERGQIIHAYAQSISAIWVFNTPVAAVGFIMGEHQECITSNSVF
jgi:hypothetical protein